MAPPATSGFLPNPSLVQQSRLQRASHEQLYRSPLSISTSIDCYRFAGPFMACVQPSASSSEGSMLASAQDQSCLSDSPSMHSQYEEHVFPEDNVQMAAFRGLHSPYGSAFMLSHNMSAEAVMPGLQTIEPRHTFNHFPSWPSSAISNSSASQLSSASTYCELEAPFNCVSSPFPGSSPAADSLLSLDPSWAISPEYFPGNIPYSNGSVPGQYDEVDDEDGVYYDKPYARLIHEALMQAPGHKMMLRDIYTWFQLNTTKPQESGTNGWQNSIRHNLSMNQAFENDKTDAGNSGGIARKANSVWTLTQHAIRHGVQSTTRYRKTGSAKKALGDRVPAVQRQKSGAKGGQAARRAARLRRQEATSLNGRMMPHSSSTGSPRNESEAYTPSSGEDFLQVYSYNPNTPAEDRPLGPEYSLPPMSGQSELSYLETEICDTKRDDQHVHDLVFSTSPAPLFGEMSKYRLD